MNSGVDFSALTGAATSAVATVGPAILSVAGIFIGVAILVFGVRRIRGQVK